MNGSGTRSHVRQLPRDQQRARYTEPTRRFVSFLSIQTVPTIIVVAPVESGIQYVFEPVVLCCIVQAVGLMSGQKHLTRSRFVNGILANDPV